MKYNHNEKKIKGQRLYFQVVGPPLQGNHRGKDLRQHIHNQERRAKDACRASCVLVLISVSLSLTVQETFPGEWLPTVV